MNVYRRRLDPCEGITGLLEPQTAEIGEHPLGVLRIQAARLHRLKAMSENARRIGARRLRHNVALMRRWLLADVEERVLVPTGLASDLLKIFLAVSARSPGALGIHVCKTYLRSQL